MGPVFGSYNNPFLGTTRGEVTLPDGDYGYLFEVSIRFFSLTEPLVFYGATLTLVYDLIYFHKNKKKVVNVADSFTDPRYGFELQNYKLSSNTFPTDILDSFYVPTRIARHLDGKKKWELTQVSNYTQIFIFEGWSPTGQFMCRMKIQLIFVLLSDGSPHWDWRILSST